MTKITNNHSATLNIAGVDVRPGATVEVDAGVFEKWIHGHAAKTWLKLGVISADQGTAITAETSDEDRQTAVSEVHENERETLLQRARALGLNPNVNTGTEKLKKMIADRDD